MSPHSVFRSFPWLLPRVPTHLDPGRPCSSIIRSRSSNARGFCALSRLSAACLCASSSSETFHARHVSSPVITAR